MSEHSAYQSWWHEADRDGLGIAAVLDLEELATRGTARFCRHARFGRVWIVDDSLLEVECDAARRELSTHLPLAARPPRPARVLVVGGGDGAIPRALLEHDPTSVSEVVLVDHADLVGLACDRGEVPSDERLRSIPCGGTVVDAIRGVGRFDLVVVDRVPEEADFLEALMGALGRDADVVIRDAPMLTRHGARWLGRGHALARALRATSHGGRLALAGAPRPFVRGGFHAFFLFAADGRDLSDPVRPWTAWHYRSDVHRAAFALPAWWPDLDTPSVDAGGALGDPRTWWHEDTGDGSGITQALALRRTLSVDSRFQSIEVHEHPRFGAVLTLDGTVQLSQADDAIYHEMATPVPLLSRPFQHASVLIIGRGGGGPRRRGPPRGFRGR